MSGWRARIGLISPIGEATERAFNLYAPTGVAINSTKLWFPGPTREGLIFLSDQLEEACSMFKKRRQRHEVILFGCTSGSLIKGVGFDKECIERIERASGIPGLTTSTALLEGFSALGNPSTAVITPYPDETNQAEKAFLEANGVEVTNIVGMNIAKTFFDSDMNSSDLEPEYLYRQAKQLDLRGAKSLFISCTGLNTMEIIQMLETDLGIPVITSNQVSLWGALRRVRVGDKIPYLGKLFTL